MSQKPLVGLVDYGRGNLRSVSKALEAAGAAPKLIADGEGDFTGLDGLVLPGVGSFGDCLRNLRARRLVDPIADWISKDQPFLGICLGYQILFESSEESPEEKGLGFFEGSVVRFSPKLVKKIPHMGWNTLRCNPGCVLFTDLPKDPSVYFVHSYYPAPVDPAILTAACDYGVPFAAAAGKGKVQGVQFHPEKSQKTGLQILQNFLESLK